MEYVKRIEVWKVCTCNEAGRLLQHELKKKSYINDRLTDVCDNVIVCSDDGIDSFYLFLSRQGRRKYSLRNI